MININKDAYGGKIRVNFGQTLTAATSFTMKMLPQSGAEISVTPTLGTSRVAVGDEYYEANEYVEYTITENMFDTYVGLWTKKALATIGSEVIPTEPELFRVTG